MPQWLKSLLVGSGVAAFGAGANVAVTHFRGTPASGIVNAVILALGGIIAHHVPTNTDASK